MPKTDIMPHSPQNTQGSCAKEPERFQSLQAGQYWRAVADIPEEGINTNLVLLIQSIRWVDNAAHTIILRPHPSLIGKEVEIKIPGKNKKETRHRFQYDEHRFLLKDFLRLFEFEPDHHRIRAEEVNQLQVKIGALQSELLSAQQNPAVLTSAVEAGLRKQASKDPHADADHENASTAMVMPTSIAQALSEGITEASINALKGAANREHQVATIKANWIKSKTTDIGDTIRAMTPFYEEQAAAALAQTEDVRSYVANMMQGIESLDLYIGKNVEVQTLREGPSAACDIPLTFVQKKVLMDEELAVWAEVDEHFDYSKESLFYEAVREHEGLINQIFPTERCVMVMAVTRRVIDYGDKWANITQNAENRKVFLLVRDGMNVHLVRSPVESHLGAAKLFPSKNDQDQVFQGFDGTQTSFDDVAYTDKLKQHGLFALHYKRFLLMACGLDHRLKLFGDFYEGPPSFNFVSLPFQKQFCRFLHDDDNTLPDANNLPVEKWIAQKNAFMRSGSRVLCHWTSLMNPETAPGACKPRDHRDRCQEGFSWHYRPTQHLSVVIARRSGDTLSVSVPVSGYSDSSHEKREFNCHVNLSNFNPHQFGVPEFAYLCLDAVRPEEVHWYIHNRAARQDHITYIRFFKQALKFLLAEQETEKPTRQRMAAALQDGGIGTLAEREEIIQRTVAAWRAENRGKPLPRFDGDEAPDNWTQLLDQMYMLAGDGTRRIAEVEAFVVALGYTPLRLVLSGAATVAVYVAPQAHECDHRVEPHAWVHRITLTRGKRKYSEKSRRWAILPDRMASESLLFEWDEAKVWAGRKPAFSSLTHKQETLALTTGFRDTLALFATTMSEEMHAQHFQAWSLARRKMMSKSRYVRNPVFSAPIGIMLVERTQELFLLCIATDKPHILLYRTAPHQEAQEAVRAAFIQPYDDEQHAYETFNNQVEAKADWVIADTPIEGAKQATGYLADFLSVPRIDIGLAFPGLLQPHFAAWQKKYGAGSQVWLADGALDAEANLDIDQLLGLTVPADYEPVRVIEVTIHHRTESPLPYAGCMDIVPVATAISDDYDPTETLLDRTGYSQQTFTRNSAAQAHQLLAQQARRQSLHLVAAIDRPEWPQAIPGIERWFLTKTPPETPRPG